MNPDWKPEVLPLGLRLQAAGAALAEAHRQRLGWVEPALMVLKNIEALPSADTSRFTRREAERLRPADMPQPPMRNTDHADAHPLSATVRERLQPFIGSAADHMRVHDDPAAHAFARQHRAAAVAIGPDVYFAEGRYQPHQRDGLALLAHEAVHVNHALRPNVGWQRSAHGMALEEGAAHAAEHAVMRSSAPRAASAPTSAASLPAAAGAPQAATPAAQQPMRAAEDRPAPTPASSAPAVDFEALRRRLLRDVMQQIRSDAERGG